MLPKIILPLICLLIGQAFANLGQDYNNNRQNQGLGQGYYNNQNGQGLGQNQGLGQGYYNNQGNGNSGLGQGFQNGGLNQGSGINGGLNRVNNPGDLNNNNGYSGNGYSGLGQGQSSQSNTGYYGQGQSSQSDTGYYGQTRQSLPSSNVRSGSIGSGNRNTYSNGYDSDENAGLTPINQEYRRQKRDAEFKIKRSLGQETQPQGLGQQTIQAEALGQKEQSVAGGLGQTKKESTSEALGQGEQPLASELGQKTTETELGQKKQSISSELGQAKKESTAEALGQGEQPLASGLGQGTAQSESLTPSLNQKSELSGQLRAKRYVEREPYKKTCNTYYGKFICYRLYEKDASIPNEFTCWSLYGGQQNCTETENVLYLDRRNVEVDPSEVDRQFRPVDRSSSQRDNRQRGQNDDEFGAVEQNLHNRHNNERQLPNDREYQRPTQSSGPRRLNTQNYDDQEDREYQRRTQSSGPRHLNTQVYDDREVRRQN